MIDFFWETHHGLEELPEHGVPLGRELCECGAVPVHRSQEGCAGRGGLPIQQPFRLAGVQRAGEHGGVQVETLLRLFAVRVNLSKETISYIYYPVFSLTSPPPSCSCIRSRMSSRENCPAMARLYACSTVEYTPHGPVLYLVPSVRAALQQQLHRPPDILHVGETLVRGGPGRDPDRPPHRLGQRQPQLDQAFTHRQASQ